MRTWRLPLLNPFRGIPPLVLGTITACVFLAIRINHYIQVTPRVFELSNLPSKIDFNHYYAAAVLFSQHTAIYCRSLSELFPLGFEWHSGIPGVTNPPPLILLTWPLAALPLETAWAIWIIAMIASMWGASYLLLREFRPTASPSQRLAVLILSLLSFPMLSSIRYGQVQPFLLLLVVLGWAQLRHGKIRGAVFWGVAIGLKVFLWPLALLFVRRQYWRTLAVLGVAVIATLCLPTAINPYANWWDFQRCAVPNISYWIETSPATVGLPGIFQRATLLAGIAPDAFGLRYVLPPILAGILVAALGLKARTSESLNNAIAPALAIAVLFAPVTWPHYYTLLFPLFLHSWRRSAWSNSRAAVLLVAWASLPYAPILYDDNRTMGLVSVLLSLFPLAILFGTIACGTSLREASPISTANE